MILRLQGGVDAAVKAMGSSHHTADGTVNESAQVQQALENILGAVGMIVDQNQQIAAAAEQQTAVAHDIDQNIVEINQAGEAHRGRRQPDRTASRELGAQGDPAETPDRCVPGVGTRPARDVFRPSD